MTNVVSLFLGALLALSPVLPIEDPYPSGDAPGTWDAVFTHDELAEIRAAGGLTAEHRALVAQRLAPPPPPPSILRPGPSAPAPNPAPAPTPDAPAWIVDLVSAFFASGDVPWALRTIRCETGGTWDPNATNPTSGASGLFQHMPRYWPERSAAAGYSGASIYDPAANVAVAAWLYYLEGRGHWPTCGYV